MNAKKPKKVKLTDEEFKELAMLYQDRVTLSGQAATYLRSIKLLKAQLDIRAKEIGKEHGLKGEDFEINIEKKTLVLKE